MRPIPTISNALRSGAIVLATFAALGSGASPASATTPPEASPLLEAKRARLKIDDKLDAWLKEHEALPIDWKQGKVTGKPKLDDKWAQYYLDLRLARERPDPKLAARVRLEIETLSPKNGDYGTVSPIMPYLLDEMMRRSPAAEKDAWAARLGSSRSYSCPERDLVLRQIDSGRNGVFGAAKAREIIQRIQGFSGQDFKESAFEALLDAMPQETREEVRPDLAKTIAQYPKLLADNQWILGRKKDEETAGTPKKAPPAEEPYLSFEKATQESRGKFCNTARTYLEDAIRLDKRREAFTVAERVTKKVEACFKAKGRAARLRFWQSMLEALKGAYGFRGEELALRARGLILWGDDDFAESRAIFGQILEGAVREKQAGIEARTIYTFARIEENEGKLAAAAEWYEKLLAKFPKDENAEPSRMSLIVTYAMLGRYKEGIVHADAIISQQDQLGLDERNANTMPYALFWGARLHLALGDKDLGLALFRRVASEYYSSFYGALAHVIIEKSTGKVYELQPAWTGLFNPETYTSAFPAGMQPHMDLIRVLLRLGLKNEAICEVSELDDGDTDARKVLLRTLYLHASGEWLEAVKRYSDLPRSFRNTLALGMERILFPRNYADQVISYAKRLNMDPDLIFAIIRQESVFNPQARSSVGARGLMQLMPATAVVEAKKLSSGYLSVNRKRVLPRHVDDVAQLYDPETNVALGVHHAYRLLERYKSAIFLLTSYNANPRATEKWMANIASDDMLAFIERIPYAETKAYVKLVLRNYFYYKRWYGDGNAPLPHLDMLTQQLVAGKAEAATATP